MTPPIDEARTWVAEATAVTVLTGAGVSGWVGHADRERGRSPSGVGVLELRELRQRQQIPSGSVPSPRRSQGAG